MNIATLQAVPRCILEDDSEGKIAVIGLCIVAFFLSAACERTAAPCALFGAMGMPLHIEVFGANFGQGNRGITQPDFALASCLVSTSFSRFRTLLRESASIAFDRSSAEPPPCQMPFFGRKPEPTFTKGR